VAAHRPTGHDLGGKDDYAETGAVPHTLRTPDELRSFFDGLEFVEPGLGPVPQWRPDLGYNDATPVIGEPAPAADAPWGGVARKP
jgi:hypothetical protein